MHRHFFFFFLFFSLTNASLHHHHHQNPNFLLHAFRSDSLRHRSTVSGIRHRRSTNLTVSSSAQSFALPLSSAAYTGVGQYLTRLQVGTPPQPALFVVDTGSDLTWMKCCRSQRCGAGRTFRAAASRTFRPVECASDLCKMSLPFSLTRCPSLSSPCFYDYGYADGSRAQGIYASESTTVTLSNGQQSQLNNIVIGCTSSFVGSSFHVADGVLGLGYSETSFAKKALSLFGGQFSYCLVDHLNPKNSSSYLVFGDDASKPSAVPLRYADLVLDQHLEPFYAVRVFGISVGEEMLNIPREVWDVSGDGGVIMDTGTSLTVLARPAYEAVTAALSRRIGGDRRVKMEPFEYCYNWTVGMEEEVGRLAVHLEGGGRRRARLQPPVKSYVVEVAEGVRCLGLIEGEWPGVSTIGNILQQNHRWVFDVGRRKMAFAPSSCLA